MTREILQKVLREALDKIDDPFVERIVLTQADAALKSPGVATHYYRFLYFLCKEWKPKICFDLGTHTGISALCMAAGNPEGKVVTVDVNLGSLHDECRRPNIEYIISDSLKVDKIPNPIDLLFLDTEHDGRCRQEYERYIPYMSKNSVVFFDDIFISKEMKEFWSSFHPLEGEKFDIPAHGDVGFGVVIIGGENENTS